MPGIVAAILFLIAFGINATSAATGAVLSPASLIAARPGLPRAAPDRRGHRLARDPRR